MRKQHKENCHSQEYKDGRCNPANHPVPPALPEIGVQVKSLPAFARDEAGKDMRKRWRAHVSHRQEDKGIGACYEAACKIKHKRYKPGDTKSKCDEDPNTFPIPIPAPISEIVASPAAIIFAALIIILILNIC